MFSLVRKTITVKLWIVIIVLATLISGHYIYFSTLKKVHKNEIRALKQKVDQVSQRLLPGSRYKYIRPLLFVEYKKEDTLLLQIKEDLLQLIDEKKRLGVIQNASVYLRLLDHHQDVRINPSEVYFPGSLMKVPLLISLLKEAETKPDFLNRKVLFDQIFEELPKQNIKSKSIELGKSYTINELLYFMIVYSDNNATALLGNNIEFDKIARVFDDLALPPIAAGNQDYSISLKDYSRFFRCLYNASYLGWEMSEYALDLLSQCTYSNGLKRNLPDDTKIALKFGEKNLDGVQQLHEMGIVYSDNQAYLIGIMTKGRDVEVLEDFIAELSKVVFDYFKKNDKLLNK